MTSLVDCIKSPSLTIDIYQSIKVFFYFKQNKTKDLERFLY